MELTLTNEFEEGKQYHIEFCKIYHDINENSMREICCNETYEFLTKYNGIYIYVGANDLMKHNVFINVSNECLYLIRRNQYSYNFYIKSNNESKSHYEYVNNYSKKICNIYEINETEYILK